RKAAELILRRERARIEEEKEYMRQEEQQRRDDEQRRRDDEQRRRDEEFRMMFAAMQQGIQQSQFGYEDMQNMIATSMNALLPGLQQMAALPPAASDPNMYQQPMQPAPQQYAAPQQPYAAPQYGAPAQSDTDDLRAQMAAQQAQMAQQQALINELLEREANRSGYAAPAQDQARMDEIAAVNARQEELLSQFDANGGAPVPLEESYGRLSDEAKRFYYDIGCFIMERPNVMQNDGKYAVLFKYRGKTLFKLSIKNDAPVLTYINGSLPAEQRVMSAEELAYAKQIMASCISQTDRELDG
ncbi:MAG: hypothetical protein K2O14_14810, partial [Oscillospiraceae bacterium]|nr:hypothetical protein [Oscillospiraceae bacterium]